MKMSTLKMFLMVSLLIATYNTEKVRYISTEHPKVTYFNPKYASYVNLTSQRYGRTDPFYYVGLNLNLTAPMHNNVSVHFYFYEFLSNTYRRGFVEIHLKLCDLLEHDLFFGEAMRNAGVPPCPVPAGVYNLHNMSVPLTQIPSNFPFAKGRIYTNVTSTATNELVGSGYIDMEIKEARIKKHK